MRHYIEKGGVKEFPSLSDNYIPVGRHGRDDRMVSQHSAIKNMVRKPKEEQRMKALKGVFIFIFLAGMILGVMGPALLYGAETTGGNPWDTCNNCWCLDKHAKGNTKLKGTLSVYFADRSSCPSGGSVCWDTYFTVRLVMGGEGANEQLFVYRERGPIVEDIINETGFDLCWFLNDVISQLFPNNNGWNIKKYDDPWGTYQDEQDLHSRAFVTDIKIVVQQ
jgi:hypothetical protein